MGSVCSRERDVVVSTNIGSADDPVDINSWSLEEVFSSEPKSARLRRERLDAEGGEGASERHKTPAEKRRPSVKAAERDTGGQDMDSTTHGDGEALEDDKDFMTVVVVNDQGNTPGKSKRKNLTSTGRDKHAPVIFMKQPDGQVTATEVEEPDNIGQIATFREKVPRIGIKQDGFTVYTKTNPKNWEAYSSNGSQYSTGSVEIEWDGTWDSGMPTGEDGAGLAGIGPGTATSGMPRSHSAGQLSGYGAERSGSRSSGQSRSSSRASSRADDYSEAAFAAPVYSNPHSAYNSEKSNTSSAYNSKKSGGGSRPPSAALNRRPYSRPRARSQDFPGTTIPEDGGAGGADHEAIDAAYLDLVMAGKIKSFRK